MAKIVMTVEKCLQEIELINLQLGHKIKGVKLITIELSPVGITGDSNKIKTAEEMDSEFREIVDLMNKRRTLMSAINKSDALSKITVCGETMSVADAINIKNDVSVEQQLLRTMKHQQSSAYSELMRRRMAEENINDKDKAKYEASLIDSLDLGHKIESLSKYIDEFRRQSYLAIRESNRETMIYVDLDENHFYI